MNQQDKLNGALRWLRKRNNPSAEETEGEVDPEKLPPMEELREESEQLPLEKGDLKAIIIAAFTTIVPACLLALLVFVGLIWLLFFW